MRELDITLSKKSEKGVYTFKLSGSLGVEGSRGMSRLFDACLKEKVYKIIIDLEEINFISSAGMGVFLSVVGELREHEGDIVFLNMPDKIKKIFSSLDVLDYFENFQSENDALKALSTEAKTKAEKEPTEKKPPKKIDHLQFIAETAQRLSLEEKSVLIIPALMESLANHLDIQDLFFAPISLPLRQEFNSISLGKGNLALINAEDTQTLIPLLKSDQGVIQLSSHTDESDAIFIKLAQMGSELIVPIFSEDNLSALLFLGERGLGARYQKEDLTMLQALAGIIGEAIQNHRIQQRLDEASSSEELENARSRLERKVQELETLFIVSRQLGSSTELEELLNNFLVITVGQMGTNKGLIFTIDETGKYLVCKAYKGQFNRIPIDLTLPVNGKLVQLVNSSSRPILTTEPDFATQISPDERKFIADNFVTLVGAISYKGELRGMTAVSAKVSHKEYSAEDLELLSTLNFQAATALENVNLFEKLRNVYSSMMKALIITLEAKDPFTKGHTERVTRLSVQFGEKLGFNRERLRNLIIGSVLHDIGKMGIREEILRKTEPLSEEETTELQKHPVIGTEVLKEVDFFASALPVVRHHHERYDGKGYPDGMAGEEIPLEARIVALANAYEAMTSTRHYRGALSKKEALEEIRKNAGTQFDPNLAKLFVQMIGEK
jgi:anti-anti-sigma factor